MPVKINGTTSGSVTLAAPATGSDVTLTLPGSAGTAALTTDTGLAFITSSTFSAASAVNINNCFTSTYDNYAMILNITAASTTLQVLLRMRAAGADNSGSLYYMGMNGPNVTADSTTYGPRSNAATSFAITKNEVRTYRIVEFNIFQPALATTTVFSGFYATPADAEGYFIQGSHQGATAYDGFSLLTSTGTISGTVRVYGYRNS